MDIPHMGFSENSQKYVYPKSSKLFWIILVEKMKMKAMGLGYPHWYGNLQNGAIWGSVYFSKWCFSAIAILGMLLEQWQ
jgi:hypothetical protein